MKAEPGDLMIIMTSSGERAGIFLGAAEQDGHPRYLAHWVAGDYDALIRPRSRYLPVPYRERHGDLRVLHGEGCVHRRWRPARLAVHEAVSPRWSHGQRSITGTSLRMANF